MFSSFLVERSIFELKLTKADIKRGVSIQINSKPIGRKNIEYIHRMPMEQRRNRIQRRKFKKTDGKVDTSNLKTVVLRSKRSIRENEPINEKHFAGKMGSKIEDLHHFNEDIHTGGEIERITRRRNSRHGSSQLMQEEEQNKQLKFINSEDYRDYAFDTTDNELFSEDDDLLRQYYGARPVRRTVTTISDNDEYGSFTDLMRFSSGENERDNQFMRRLHYGDDDSFLNDNFDDDNSQNDEEIYDEYDNYDDDDY